jgi:hypothetical protein
MSAYITDDNGEPFMRIEDAVRLLKAPPENHDWLDRLLYEAMESPRPPWWRRWWAVGRHRLKRRLP